jgi:hypothetical protein
VIAGRGRPRRRTGRRLSALPAALALAGALGGCGGGLTLPDLMAVQRSGSIPGASLNLVVNDGGTARCNGGRPVPITDAQLLQARSLARDLHDPAKRALTLAPGGRSVLRYFVRTQDGHVSFSDDSAGQPPVFFNVALLVRQIAQQDCHLPR